jgi:hypothetical protein
VITFIDQLSSVPGADGETLGVFGSDNVVTPGEDSAMAHVDEAPAARTRIVSIYSLRPQLSRADERLVGLSQDLSAALDLGFLHRFVTSSRQLFPRVLLVREVAAADFNGPTGGLVADLVLTVLVMPRGGLILLVVAGIDSEVGAARIADYLVSMHYQRDAQTIYDGQPLGKWVSEELGLSPRDIGYAHMMVFAGGALARDILDNQSNPNDGETGVILDALASDGPDRGGQVNFRVLAPLSHPNKVFVANGRLVTLVAGWSRSVQDALVFVALTVVAGFGVLRQARERASQAMEEAQSDSSNSIDSDRRKLADLADALDDIQLDLSFGVELYADSVLIPDSRMDTFRLSYQEMVGMDTALANTSSIVERLGAVIQARSSVLTELGRQHQERQERILGAVVAIGSLLTIPLTLLLAFFGVSSSDVDPGRSMLDFARYWPAYILAWVPFTALVFVAIGLRRRVRASGLTIPRRPAPGHVRESAIHAERA